MTIILLSLLTLAGLLEIARRRLPAMQRLLLGLSGGALRPFEENHVTGGTFLLLGYTLTWLIFPPVVAAPAMLVAATADPAASLVGTAVTGARGSKTIAGSVAALIVALAVLRLTGASWTVAAIGALIAAIVERLPGRGSDNVAIPIATAAALVLAR